MGLFEARVEAKELVTIVRVDTKGRADAITGLEVTETGFISQAVKT